MGRVCLILPVASASTFSEDWVMRCRAGLEGAGHDVAVLAVLDGDGALPENPADGSWTWRSASRRGLSSAAMTGIDQADARGDFVVVLDPARGYDPADLPAMVGPLADGSADLVVARRIEGDHTRRAGVFAARGRRVVAAGVGVLARPLVGASDLFSGLVAVTSPVARQVSQVFDPVGSRFTVDLLFRAGGRRVEVPVRVEGPNAPPPLHLDDLRHVKRLADDRFGNASRLLQFCAVGASGMVVDLSCYAVFQLVFSSTAMAGRTLPLVGYPLDLAAAAAASIALALTWNFSLNRRLTFNDARHGSIVRQYLTYAVSNALGIALSFTLRLYLPAHVGFFQRHKLAAAVVGIVAATGISFSMSRWLVFGKRTPPPPHPPHARSSVARTTSAI